LFTYQESDFLYFSTTCLGFDGISFSSTLNVAFTVPHYLADFVKRS